MPNFNIQSDISLILLLILFAGNNSDGLLCRDGDCLRGMNDFVIIILIFALFGCRRRNEGIEGLAGRHGECGCGAHGRLDEFGGNGGCGCRDGRRDNCCDTGRDGRRDECCDNDRGKNDACRDNGRGERVSCCDGGGRGERRDRFRDTPE